jgi:chromosome segregation ATPase
MLDYAVMPDDIRAALAEFAEQLDQKLDSRFAAIDGRFAGIDDRFTAMERRIDESAAETRNFARILTEDVRDDLKRIGDGVIAANGGLEALRRDVATLDKKVERIDLKVLSVTSVPPRRLKRRR